MASDLGKKSFEETYGRITDEGIADLRSRIGKPIRSQSFGPPIPVASEDSIRLWAWGIGDDNPLYTSTQYGERSVWKSLTAPPSIALAMDPHRLGIMGGLPGVHALYAGVNFRWHRPIAVGDQVETSAAVQSVDERTRSAASGRSVLVKTVAEIGRRDGQKLATLEHVVTRHDRSHTREKGNFTRTDFEIPHRYASDDIAEYAQAYRDEVDNRRGSEDFRWEDVRVGDSIGPLLKGPLTITGIVAFALAVRPVHLTVGHRLAFQLFDRHPGLGIPNESNVPEPPISVHWSENHAKYAGLPTAYDFGMERACWAAHLFTDWMGDSAFLQSLKVRFLKPNYLGDITRFTGAVEERREVSNALRVRCSFEGVNQRGETTTSGEAVVLLPHPSSSPDKLLSDLPSLGD